MSMRCTRGLCAVLRSARPMPPLIGATATHAPLPAMPLPVLVSSGVNALVPPPPTTVRSSAPHDHRSPGSAATDALFLAAVQRALHPADGTFSAEDLDARIVDMHMWLALRRCCTENTLLSHSIVVGLRVVLGSLLARGLRDRARRLYALLGDIGVRLSRQDVAAVFADTFYDRTYASAESMRRADAMECEQARQTAAATGRVPLGEGRFLVKSRVHMRPAATDSSAPVTGDSAVSTVHTGPTPQTAMDADASGDGPPPQLCEASPSPALQQPCPFELAMGAIDPDWHWRSKGAVGSGDAPVAAPFEGSSLSEMPLLTAAPATVMDAVRGARGSLRDGPYSPSALSKIGLALRAVAMCGRPPRGAVDAALSLAADAHRWYPVAPTTDQASIAAVELVAAQSCLLSLRHRPWYRPGPQKAATGEWLERVPASSALPCTRSRFTACRQGQRPVGLRASHLRDASTSTTALAEVERLCAINIVAETALAAQRCPRRLLACVRALEELCAVALDADRRPAHAAAAIPSPLLAPACREAAWALLGSLVACSHVPAVSAAIHVVVSLPLFDSPAPTRRVERQLAARALRGIAKGGPKRLTALSTAAPTAFRALVMRVVVPCGDAAARGRLGSAANRLVRQLGDPASTAGDPARLGWEALRAAMPVEACWRLSAAARAVPPSEGHRHRLLNIRQAARAPGGWVLAMRLWEQHFAAPRLALVAPPQGPPPSNPHGSTGHVKGSVVLERLRGDRRAVEALLLALQAAPRRVHVSRDAPLPAVSWTPVQVAFAVMEAARRQGTGSDSVAAYHLTADLCMSTGGMWSLALRCVRDGLDAARRHNTLHGDLPHATVPFPDSPAAVALFRLVASGVRAANKGRQTSTAAALGALLPPSRRADVLRAKTAARAMSPPPAARRSPVATRQPVDPVAMAAALELLAAEGRKRQ